MNNRKKLVLNRKGYQRLADQVGQPRAPDFYVIGAEKCGTTWLWQMFRDHPKIGASMPKELRYFSSLYLNTGFDNFNSIRRLLEDPRTAPNGPRKMIKLATEIRIAFGGDDAYLRIFGEMQEDVVGDITPQYCMLPEKGLKHMQRLAPLASIIFLLRDPVARVISAGKMKAAEQNSDLNDALIRNKALDPFQITMSRYSDILERYEAAFPGRVFVGFMDDILSRPHWLLREICEFLNVEYRPEEFTGVDRVANKGKTHTVGDELQQHLYGVLKGEYDGSVAKFHSVSVLL